MQSIQEVHSFVEDELEKLHAIDPKQPATTVIVLAEPWSYEDLRRYADMMTQQLFGEYGIHVIPFHPLAYFDEDHRTSRWDAHDYVMRSPHPTLHLLRIADTDVACKQWAKKYDLEDGLSASFAIKDRNTEYLRRLGWKRVAEISSI